MIGGCLRGGSTWRKTGGPKHGGRQAARAVPAASACPTLLSRFAWADAARTVFASQAKVVERVGPLLQTHCSAICVALPTGATMVGTGAFADGSVLPVSDFGELVPYVAADIRVAGLARNYNFQFP